MNECAIDWCHRERVPASLYCRTHLNDLWHNRAVVVERRPEPEWVRRARAHALPPKELAA